jgi:cytochrome c biogenesis protein CcmG, thiol:disulfide interchange protein DsbE
MKFTNNLKALGFGACALIAVIAFNANAVEPGAAAPEFEFAGLTKPEKVKLSGIKAKVIYVDFWASWCGPCRQSFPWMNAMQEKYGSQGLQIVGINLDAKKEDALQFLAATPATFIALHDPAGASAKQYAIKGMPSSVLVSGDGKVIQNHAGFRESDKAELEAKFRSALGLAK